MNILASKTSCQRMAAFDGLPEPVRRAMAEADFPYDADFIARRIKRRKAERIAAEIRALTLRRACRDRRL